MRHDRVNASLGLAFVSMSFVPMGFLPGGLGEQQSGQLSGGRPSEHEVMDVAIGCLVIPAQTLCGVCTHFAVGIQQFQKTFPLDKR